MVFTAADYYAQKAEREKAQAVYRSSQAAQQESARQKAIETQTRNLGKEPDQDRINLINYLNSRSTTSKTTTTESKPVFTGITQPQSIAVPGEQKSKLILNQEGKVVGVQDAITKQSYSIAPASVETIRQQEAERYQRINKPAATNRYTTTQLSPETQEAIKAAQAKSLTGNFTQARPPLVISIPEKPDTQVNTRLGSASFTQGGVVGAYNPNAPNNIDAETQKAYSKVVAAEKEPVILKSFKASLTATPDEILGGSVFQKQSTTGNEIQQLVGGFTGLYGNVALKALGITTGTKVAGAAFTATKGITTAASANAFTATGLNVLGQVAVAGGTFKVVKTLEEGKQRIVKGLPLTPTQEEREVFNVARKAERAKLQSAGGFGGIINSVGFEIGLSGNPDVFTAAAAQELRNRKILSDTAPASLEAMRAGTKEGTIAATLAVGAFSEQTGQLAMQRAFGSGEKATFKTFAANIFPAGVGEGFGQTLVSQENVGDLRTGTKFFTEREQVNLFGLVKAPLTRFEEAAAGGIFGGVTAGFLGGAIGSAAAKGQKSRQFLLESIGNILDPTEKPSDILQDIIVGTSKDTVRINKFTGVPVMVNAFSNTPVKTTVQSNMPTQVKRVKARANTPVTLESLVGNYVPVNTLTDVPAGEVRNNVFSFDGFRKPTMVDTFITAPVNDVIPVPVNSDVPIPVNTDIPVPVSTNTVTNTATTTNIFTNVPTNIFTNVPTNVPVFTDVLNAPLPLPISMPSGAGSTKGVGRKQRTAFLDELALSNNIFLGNFGINPYTPKVIRTTTRRKPRAKSAARTPSTKVKKLRYGFIDYRKLAGLSL
jgi:hypothetical protein